MTISMYQSSVPVFVQFLTSASHVLEKGATHARETARNPDALLELRQVDDMLPLVAQVRIATDMAKNCVGRLADVELMPVPDDETTFDQLQTRIARVVDYVSGFTPAQIDGTEARPITLKMGNGKQLDFTGQDYLLGFVLPNFYFHLTATYMLLRRDGATLGKMDFFGRTES